MKPTTRYWIGVKHVGIKGEKAVVAEMAASQMALVLQNLLKDVTLAQRIDLSIARTEEEVLVRLEGAAMTAKTVVFPDLDQTWDELMEQEK